jgi:uncharacterized protein YjbI with pentapeptide repeats
MLKLIAWTTLVVFPILLLLLLQIQFLPFHDVRITNAQRGALILDIVLLWLLRPPILADLSAECLGRARVRARVLRGIGFSLAGVTSIAALWFSIVVATIPGEWQETALAGLDRSQWRFAEVAVASTHDLLFAGEVDDTTRRRKSLFSNTLVLLGFNLYEALKVDDPKKLAWKEHLFDFRARHLEQAVFDGSDLTKADLTGAFLEGASLKWAQLQGASLNQAQLQGASLDFAQLQGASLYHSRLQGASLDGAQLRGASLIGAQLQGASLEHAQLQGASLDSAGHQGAQLPWADLQGASLYVARLQGAALCRSQLQGAQLQGASLEHAQLQGAALDGAQLRGASLDGAQLQGVSLLDGAQLQGASLIEANLQGASLDPATVSAADFSYAFLWRTQWIEGDPNDLGVVRLDETLEQWKPVWRTNDFSDPVSWNAKSYAELRGLMNMIPEGEKRDAALKQIERLDCANPDKTLASCDPAAKTPRDVLIWQKKLKAASVDEAAYAKALATELRSLVCVSDVNAIYILRGLTFAETCGDPMIPRLTSTDREAPALVDFIMSKDCPVSAALTNDDRAKLLMIKQDAELKSLPPPPAAKKEK